MGSAALDVRLLQFGLVSAPHVDNLWARLSPLGNGTRWLSFDKFTLSLRQRRAFLFRRPASAAPERALGGGIGNNLARGRGVCRSVFLAAPIARRDRCLGIGARRCCFSFFSSGGLALLLAGHGEYWRLRTLSTMADFVAAVLHHFLARQGQWHALPFRAGCAGHLSPRTLAGPDRKMVRP